MSVSVTVQDICTSALQNLGVVGTDETPNPSDLNIAFKQLNNMIDAWSTESLMVYSVEPQVFPYVSGQGTYTIGTGGNFNTDRPIKIMNAYSRDSAGNDYKMLVTENSQDYADIIAKGVTSSIPQLLFDEGDYPLKNLTFWPVPSDSTYSVVLWVWTMIDSVSTLSTVLSLPPGYQRAIEYCLSIELAPKFAREPQPSLVALAIESKAQIMISNTDVLEMAFPDEIVGTRRISILTGY